MARLVTATRNQIRSLLDDAGRRLTGCACLEEAAQRLADLFYERYTESTVLVRVFATVRFDALPPPNQDFVRRMAARADAAGAIADETLVLSLLGTRGANKSWNSRHDSQGHVGIPLAGAVFIETVPMIARLLKELGVTVEGVPDGRGRVTIRTVGSLRGVFFVDDASTARDDFGRSIIADQGFVAQNGVATVFGFGGAYMLERSFVAVVVFARERVPREIAERFAPLASVLKTATMLHVNDGRIFAPGS